MPTTLQHLTAPQQNELFKVIHLLNSPAHLTAHRQTSRSLSVRDQRATSTSPGRCEPGVSSNKKTPLSKKISAPTSLAGSSYVSQTYNCGSQSGEESPTERISDVHLSQVPYPFEENCQNKELNESQSDNSSVHPTHDALVDNVFTASSSIKNVQRNTEKSAHCSNRQSTNSFIRPRSFLCVPMPDPNDSSKSISELNNALSDSKAASVPHIVVLACFVDKMPDGREKVRKRTKILRSVRSKDSETQDCIFNQEDVDSILECLRYFKFVFKVRCIDIFRFFLFRHF